MVQVTFTTQSGESFASPIGLANLLSARAFRDPFSGHLVFTNFGAGEKSVETLRGELRHELTHALISARIVPKDLIIRLSGHADSLPDRQVKDYLRDIGIPHADRVRAGTLRDAYSELYGGLPDFEYRMQQEAIAHAELLNIVVTAIPIQILIAKGTTVLFAHVAKQ